MYEACRSGCRQISEAMKVRKRRKKTPRRRKEKEGIHKRFTSIPGTFVPYRFILFLSLSVYIRSEFRSIYRWSIEAASLLGMCMKYGMRSFLYLSTFHSISCPTKRDRYQSFPFFLFTDIDSPLSSSWWRYVWNRQAHALLRYTRRSIRNLHVGFSEEARLGSAVHTHADTPFNIEKKRIPRL